MPVSANISARPGFPAIQEPREFLLAPFQQQIRNIRERFKNLEGQLERISAVVSASNSAQTELILQAQINALQEAINGLAEDISNLSNSTNSATNAAFAAIRFF
jgi:peptidoglycan hydrolase CwlO-like protein